MNNPKAVMSLSLESHSPPQESRHFSGRDFRDALGRFATGVAIITSVGSDGYLGATVSSFSSVSLDPPLILFSIGRHSKAFAAWESVDHFAVNILAEEQSALSTQFARAMSDKWSGVQIHKGINGSPLLADALVWLECKSYAKYDGGDHVIIVGEVLALAKQSATDARPLVFFGGKYRQLDTGPALPTPSDADLWLHGW
jgi:flavin reductase (DIM6/NTAB) family NADH-FMN oxidoreductase RutF